MMNLLVITLLLANAGITVWTYKKTKTEKSKIDELVLVELSKVSRDNGITHGQLETLEGKVVNYGCMTLDKLEHGHGVINGIEGNIKKEVKATILEQLIIPPPERKYILVPVTQEGKICR